MYILRFHADAIARSTRLFSFTSSVPSPCFSCSPRSPRWYAAFATCRALSSSVLHCSFDLFCALPSVRGKFEGLVVLSLQLFFSYFKELVGKEVTVELKNDLAIRGILHSVDQYLNIKLENIRVVDQDKYPHMLSVRNCFIRGSVVRYVQLPPDGVDIDILHDATRREARGG
ncbi:hypothetical protein Cni_G11931 [Canna indica]|uniref:Sm domain-containing protein n=2 Tax=Magnoliopsida TaxID=3398 RepID=A0AAQ3QBB5_9LILI|nr:hypothetical protein Cni_G11931 [Canna indica]